MVDVNVDKLREYLVDYYGSAMFSGFPFAIFDLEKVKNASPQELIEIAQKSGIDLGDYSEYR